MGSMSYGEYIFKNIMRRKSNWKYYLPWSIVYELIEDGHGTIDNGNVYFPDYMGGSVSITWSRDRTGVDEHRFSCEFIRNAKETIMSCNVYHIYALSDLHCTIRRMLKFDALREASTCGWLVPVMERLGLC